MSNKRFPMAIIGSGNIGTDLMIKILHGEGPLQAGRESARADEMAVPLDLLLTTSATGVARRMMPDASWSRFGLSLASQPSTVAERVGSLGRELVSITRGTSDRAPAKADKRFSDPAWQGNPLMKRSMQAYLAANDTVDELFSDAHLSWRDAEQMRFVLDVVMEGLSPSNNPLISPLGWKAMIDTGGLSLLRGVRHFLSDMASPPRIPSMVEPDAFTVGETVAVSAGAVVYRSEVFELIQYTPQPENVTRENPTLAMMAIAAFQRAIRAPADQMILWRNAHAEMSADVVTPMACLDGNDRMRRRVSQQTPYEGD